ncbi:MAG: diadenylate cyclase CdaA [Phycisphaerae bacterium]
MWQNIHRSIVGYFERISSYGWPTVAVELFVIGLVIYVILNFLQGTRGLRLLRGLVLILVTVFLVLQVLAERMHLERIKVLAAPVLYGVFFSSLVVFQPELRLALMRIGEARWLRRLISDSETTIAAIISAVKYLSAHKIGTLIAIERQVNLGTIVDSGVRMDAAITPELIKTIFWPGSALHDLGMVIQEGQISASGCQFPLTESGDLDPSLGSRHRSAVGLTEDCDAVVIVISEETGIISIALEGKIHRGFTPESLEQELRKLLYVDTNVKQT